MTEEKIEKFAEEYANKQHTHAILQWEKIKQAFKEGADFTWYSNNAELKDENNKLLDVINNQDVKIADLEKKNAELKETIADIEKNFRICESNADTNYDQLTKAKEIIKNLLILKNDHYGNTKMEWRVEVTEQAEQFLKEIEK